MRCSTLVRKSSKEFIELHILEPIKRRPSTVGDREVNPIPKPRRHSNLELESKESRLRDRGEDNADNEREIHSNLAKDRTESDAYTTKRRYLARHSCELAKTSNSCLPRLPPNAKPLARLKRKFQKLILVSERHPLTRFFLRSRASVNFEKKRHSRSANWWVIHPFSDLRFAWEILMTLTFLYLFFAVPYINAFYRMCSKKGFDKLYFLGSAYVACIVDIFMNFVTGFTSDDGHEIFLDPALIARHYSQRYFLIDLLTSVPYTWFTSGTLGPPGPQANFPAVIAESLPLLKLLRLLTLRSYMKKWSKVFGLSEVFDVGLWLCLLTVLIFHWSACITYAFPFFVLHATRTTIEDSDAYAVKSGLYKEPSWRVYLVSLHMGISNLVGSSFVEFRKTSAADKMIRCFLLLFGTGYTIWLIVIVLQLVEYSAKPELKYQEIIHNVREYTRDKKLPERLEKRLKDYYEYRFQGSYFKENAISNTLSNHLKEEINVRSSRGLLETATIFHNLPRTLLGRLMASVKSVIYLQDDVVIKCGTDGDCMYFIASGTVAVINSFGIELCHLEDGDYFGEISLLYAHRRRDVSILALEVCELLRLDRRDFKRLIPPRSELYARIERVAKERLAHMAEINKLVEEEEARKKKPKAKDDKPFIQTGKIGNSSALDDTDYP